MKSILRIFLIIAAVAVFSSCRKSNDLGPQLTGSWVLVETAQYNGFGWTIFRSGLEQGMFNFFSNGNATYADAYGNMSGYWSVATVRDGYYDEFGQYYTDLHDAMQIDLRDPNNGDNLNLYFNDVSYQGSTFYGTYYSGNYIVRYRFVRY